MYIFIWETLEAADYSKWELFLSSMTSLTPALFFCGGGGLLLFFPKKNVKYNSWYLCVSLEKLTVTALSLELAIEMQFLQDQERSVNTPDAF